MYRIVRWLTPLLLVLLIAPYAWAQSDQRCFPETRQCIAGRIREFWEQNGELPVFGFPIGPQQEEQIEGKPFQVQWFERARFELHPENAPPYNVLLGLLGNEVHGQGAPPPPPPPPPPGPPPVGAPQGVCAQGAPAPAEGAQAWMTVANPARRSDTTLCVRLIVNGQAVAGASVSGTAHYKTTETALGPATTGADGVAQITFNIGGASSGFTVRVDATATGGGQTYTAQTSFTPQ